ncbi:hypothetical protein AtNW77_Chr4g0291561 [Arabidopsis thaliana]
MELWSPVAEIIRRSSEPSQCMVQSGDGARQQGMCGEIVPAMHRLGGQRDDNILICGVLSISLWFKNAMVPRSGGAGSDSVSG